MKPSNKNAGLESLEKLASSDNIVKGLENIFPIWLTLLDLSLF